MKYAAEQATIERERDKKNTQKQRHRHRRRCQMCMFKTKMIDGTTTDDYEIPFQRARSSSLLFPRWR